jgi:hypothetical protein
MEDESDQTAKQIEIQEALNRWFLRKINRLNIVLKKKTNEIGVQTENVPYE